MAHQGANPFDGKTQITYHERDVKQLEGSIESSSRSFEGGMRTSYASRAAIVSNAASRVNLQIRESRIEVAPLRAALSIYPNDQLTRFSAPNLMVDDEVTVENARCVQQCAVAFEKLTKRAGASVDAFTVLPRSNEPALSKVLDQVKRAVIDVATLIEGATLVLGGHRIDRPGTVMRPAVLTDVNVNQLIWTPRARLFGSITSAAHGPELSSIGIEEVGDSVRVGALDDHG